MNPIERRIEPETPETPEEWARFVEGETVSLKGWDFRVSHVSTGRQRITLTVMQPTTGMCNGHGESSI